MSEAPGTLRVDDPFTGEVAFELPLATEAEAMAAVDRAARAQRAWAEVPVAERARLVHRFADALVARREEVARDISRQMGKPLAEARGEVGTCAVRARHMASIAEETLADERLPEKEGYVRFVSREPLGVVVDVAPWNYPLLTAVNVVAPAVLAGNALVLKHASRTPVCAEHFARAFREAGAPAGLVEPLVAGHGVVAKVLGRPEVGLAALTGSNAAGREVHAAAARRLLPVVLELGGKDAAYVAEDADLAFAAPNVVEGAFYNAGQSCCGVKRIYVHERVHGAFLDAALAAAKAWAPGDPSADGTTLGPLATPEAPADMERQVREARSRGARVLCGGERASVGGKGRFFLPTLVEGAPPDAEIAREESFGPVAIVERVASDEEAVARVNASRYGLSASVWTRSEGRARALARRIEAGTVFMNRCDYLDPALPWVGWKQSGLGLSLSRHGLLALTRAKSHHLRVTTG
ncbi:MAG TPA: aldehyde dehydrogenase family protein [Anaeromyxobacteraceae bacterium]|nr:aldehyde dehydrogenase family protein [Anaeromyxobacteraceae bacterium]